MIKQLLIVTSKWPGKTDSSDGGNSTVREIIDILHREYIIDILYFGRCICSESLKGISNVIKCDMDFDHYESYSMDDDSKFSVRLKQANVSADIINTYQENYDRIIIIHDMFLLGINPDNSRLLDKVILFPMFTGEAYKICGEIVPDEYISRERNLLNKVKAIVSPSESEKNTLITQYGVLAKKIHVINRCVDRFSYSEHKLEGKMLRLLYIASVRKQKSHIDAISLLKMLTDRGMNVSLTCIGAIQDQDIYEQCVSMGKRFDLSERIFFLGNLEPDEINSYLLKSDINISVSKWETFGRGIFEGLAAGVPTIALSRIKSLDGYVPSEAMPILCADVEGMSRCIMELENNRHLYLYESKKGLILRKYLSTEKVKKQLLATME